MSEQDNGFTHKDGVSLKEYFESRMAATEKALQLAAQVQDVRNAAQNEWRATITDLTAKFVPRSELDLLHKQLQSDLQMLREANAKYEGKASQTLVVITLVIALAAVIVAIAGLISTM